MSQRVINNSQYERVCEEKKEKGREKSRLRLDSTLWNMIRDGLFSYSWIRITPEMVFSLPNESIFKIFGIRGLWNFINLLPRLQENRVESSRKIFRFWNFLNFLIPLLACFPIDTCLMGVSQLDMGIFQSRPETENCYEGFIFHNLKLSPDKFERFTHYCSTRTKSRQGWTRIG